MKDKNQLIVVQSNKLVEAHYKQEYTIQEQRTVLWLIGEIHEEDFIYHKNDKLKEIKISASDYANLVGTPVKNIYRDAKKIGEKLMEKVLAIKEAKGWLLVHWVSSMKYDDGIIEITVHPKLIPYLINLKETFTSFKLENILYLNSSHAIKIYQLLSQYKSIGERKISLEDLRSTLGIDNTKTYQLYGALKQRVLDISKREINAKTDISFSYKPIKEGRKVIAIQFKITSKTQDKPISLENKIALQLEAKACFIRCGGGCAASWNNHKSNMGTSCYHCQKFSKLRAE